MPERILTLPDSTDQFVVTDRPAPTLTGRYRMLPDGMNHTLFVVVRAHQVRTGDVVAALFTDGPGIRHSRHVPEAFTAHPRAFGNCPAECEACEDAHTYGATTDRYVCLDAADDDADCVIVFRNAPVAIIRADIASSFPPLDSAPPLPDLFALDGEHGPYEALPVSRTWGPYDAISVDRTTAEQIAVDLPLSHAGRHLTCRWLGDALLITSDPRFRTEPGRPGRIIQPDADGRYRIGGLWPWEEWPGEDEDPQGDGTEPDPTGEAGDATAETSASRALPDTRTDAIHTYFGLSYANYLVRPRTLLQSMPDQWQTRFVALLNELDAAFQHLPQAEAYDVTPGKWRAVRDMTEDEMHSVNIRRSELADGTPYLIRDDWHDQDPDEQFFLEEQDPVPHYNRGRTRVEPHADGAR